MKAKKVLADKRNHTIAQIEEAEELLAKVKVSDDDLPCVSHWVSFDFMKLDTRPKKYGKYLICRKDGKIHWETWNGSGWAYNHNEIRYWAEIISPCG